MIATGDAGSAETPWFKPRSAAEFRLYTTAPSRRLLARLRVGSDSVARTEVVAMPPRPRDTPAVIDRLLQLLPFAGLVALGLLATSWLREARADR